MPNSFCDENQGTGNLTLTWVLLAIGIITVGLRVYVRSGVNRKIGWDDYTAVAALVVAIVASGFFTKAIASGMGRHRSCLPPESIVAMLEFCAICEAVHVLGIGIIKISVCLALLRVVERARRGITLFLRFLLVFVAVTHLALAMLLFLHCRPLAALWNKEVHGSCMSTRTAVLAGYVGFAVDIVTDLVCAGIPTLVIHRLQMSFRTKVALCVLMGLGVFTAGCAVAKAIALRGVFAHDVSVGFTKPATWAAVEQLVGIIIISLPALRPWLSSITEKTHSWSGIWKYVFWANKTLSLVSSKKGCQHQQQQPQQIQDSRSKSDLKESARTKKFFVPWYRDVGSLFSSSDSSQATAVNEQSSKEVTREADPEKGLFGDNLGLAGGRNYLMEWSLPDIADQGSAMISMPLFHV